MSHNPRRILTPGASRKRKEIEAFYSPKPLVQPTAVSGANPSTTSFNRVLAGYMAYEFLSKGTLLGQKFDPAQRQSRLSTEDSEPKPMKPQCYAEVAGLLRADVGAHIPGVVNPTQLARWIQM